MSHTLTLSVLIIVAMTLSAIAAQPSPAEYKRLADEVESHLMRDVVQSWFPRTIDREVGGFHANFSRDWQKRPSSGRFIVFQARQTWISAQIAMHRPALRDQFLEYTRYGAKYLNDVMWDREFGGFHWQLDDNGKLPANSDGAKHLYGEAFGIYAAAAAYEATRDPASLDLAMRAFNWMEQHAHDAKNGGYHECLTREGKVIRAADQVTPQNAQFSGFIRGFKSMNAHIHMLEALSQLYHASKDDKVKQRLAELLAIVRDKVAVEPGCLNLWLTEDWRAVPDHDSFGHDIETGFLLIEAAESLGEREDPRTLRMARTLVDHTLDWGWDAQNGGVGDKGYAFTRGFEMKKVWWTQVEALNALLLMHEHFGRQTDRYWDAFVKQWEFVSKHQIDSQFPGVFEEVEPNGEPIQGRMNKGHNWKAGYHDGRTFLLVSDRLRKLAAE